MEEEFHKNSRLSKGNINYMRLKFVFVLLLQVCGISVTPVDGYVSFIIIITHLYNEHII